MSLLTSVSQSSVPLRTTVLGATFRRAFATIKGESSTPLLNVTVGQLIDQTTDAKEFKDVYRCVHQDYRWTWEELKKFVDATAVGFNRSRLVPNKRLTVLVNNDTELIVSALASARAGVLTDFVDTTIAPDALDAHLRQINPRGILASIDVAKSTVLSVIPELPFVGEKENPRLARYPDLRAPITSGWDVVKGFSRLSDLLVSDPLPSPLPRIEASITPQQPQYAHELVHTQSNVINTGYLVGKQLGLKDTDRILAAINLNTPTGLGLGVFSTLTHAATLIVPSSTLDTSSILKAIANEHVNVLVIYADTLQTLSTHPKFSADKFAEIDKVLIVHDVTRTATPDSFVQNLKFKSNAKISVAHVSPSGGVFLLRDLGSNSASALPHSELRTTLANGDAKEGEVGQLFVRGALTPSSTASADSFNPLPSDKWVKTGVKAKIEKGKVVVVDE
eukprot:TRINITY_DN5745_c0_g1_i1.p1 TRINITY_DN5745_c0_g1~~TRINITY_DN5745_c0_g1_i1.p1  ORF type:complete len:449 (+),score=90.72 TRINITY_DN5745_c0_g1_i1:151-1497(+)